MDTIKKLINLIIEDLWGEKPICSILLKAQVIASKLENQEFANWIKHEQQGYDNASLPKYRILPACVKVIVVQPITGNYQTVDFPVDCIEQDNVAFCLSHVWIQQSLFEIESMCMNHEGSMLHHNVPAMAYPNIQEHVNGKVHEVWQELTVTSALGIIHIFRAQLLAFFLDLEKSLNMEIDFSNIEAQQTIKSLMEKNNIVAGVVNLNGTVTTGDISMSNVSQVALGDSEKDEILKCISQLNDEIKRINNPELKEAVAFINEECKKPSWSKKILKIGLNTLKRIAVDLADESLTSIIAQAFKLLG